MKQFTRSMGLALLMAASVQGAAIFPLPPFTVYGKVRDWNGRALSSDNAATVVVRDTNGMVLARCDVKSGIYPGLTYRLPIPMASGRQAGRGQAGDPLTFDVYYDGQLHTASAGQGVRVGNPAGSINCTLNLGTFSSGGGLPDEYKELLRAYYDEVGRASGLGDISPDDDFDSDGYSNFEEFLAGTIPVQAEDYLRITRFTRLADGRMALCFLSAPGRAYSVTQKPRVSGGNPGNPAAFALTRTAPPAQTFYAADQDAETTLYLPPTTNASAFFRLRAQ
jgi:hypothetical protein